MLLIFEKLIKSHNFAETLHTFLNINIETGFISVSKNLIQHLKKKPLVFTVCYNSLLVELGFKLSSKNREKLNKALNVISTTSLETLYTSPTPDKTVFLRLIQYKKNRKQVADLHINPVSFFYYYSNPVIGFNSCISCIRQEISKTFRSSAPTYTFAIFFYILTQLKNVS